MSLYSRFTNFTKTIAQKAASAFSATPPAVPGVGNMPPTYTPLKDTKQETILNSKEALFGRTTYFLGPNQNYISTYPGSGLTPQRITSIHNEVLTAGYMLNKACLDEDIIMRDGHLRGVDIARRVATIGKPLFFRPVEGSELAQKLADLTQSFVDDIDHFDDSMKRLLYANAAGYGMEECWYENKTIRIPIDQHINIGIKGIFPKQLDWVSNKHTRFDVQTDELLLDTGAGKFVSLPSQKFITHYASDDFQKRRRGYMYQAVWYHLIKHEAIARWAVILDIWGIPVPYGVADESLWQDERRKAEMVKMIQDYGLGRPAVFTSDFEIKPSPTISSGDARGMHAALIGWCNTELSKLIQGETLTTELGGMGSYNASETHAATKESIVAMDMRSLSNTLRPWIRDVLALNIEVISQTFNASPEEILRLTPIPYWRIEREVTPMQRMQMFDYAVNNLGMQVDEDQVYQEFGITKARNTNKRLAGKPLQLFPGSQTTGTTDATEVVRNPSAEEIKADLGFDPNSAPPNTKS